MKEKSLIARYGIFLAAIIVYIIISYIPLGQEILTINQTCLTENGRKVLGILAFCLVLWVAEPIPFHITGFIGILLIFIFRIETFSDLIKQGFGNETIIFFIGVLTLSAMVTKTGLGRRICMYLLVKTGNDTYKIVLGFLTVGAFLSMWMTEMAAAAILMPLGVTILQNERLKPNESKFGKCLMIACAWGPIIGGMGTPAGAGANPLAIGFLNDIAGITITFSQWMLYGIPSSLILILPSWIILTLFFKPEKRYLAKSKEEMKQDAKSLPPMSRDEKNTLLIFAVTIFLWISSGWLGKALNLKISTAIPALISLCLFFMPGIVSVKWKELQKEISWDGILLIACGISLGLAVYKSGAAQWLALLLLNGIAKAPMIIRIFMIIFIISLLKIGLSSNTVTASIIVPIIIVLADTYNMEIMSIAIPACLTLSLAFILVTSTPTSIIPYSSGYFTIGDMAKAGIVMTLVSCIILSLFLYFIGKITGIYI